MLALAVEASASDKKGVGIYDLNASDRLAQLNVAWYYTWSPRPIAGAPPEKLVPMIWGGSGFAAQVNALRARGRVPDLLAINEPDEKKQANMSVHQVAHLWPRISGLADRIGSPAAEFVMGAWMERFFRAAQDRHLKMDFMAVHLYPGADSKWFLAKLDAVYERYRLPIWLTEFAVADWDTAPWIRKSTVNRYSEEAVLQFMKEVLPELEQRPYVVRYAWFGAGPAEHLGEELRTSRLFEKDGTLTPLGRFYADFTGLSAPQ